MSLQSYPDRVASASDVTATRPRAWRDLRLKSVLRQVTDRAENADWKLALENIESWTGTFIETATELEGDGIEFREGDVLFGKLRPYLAKVFTAPRAGAAVGDFLVLRPLSDIQPRFLRYVLASPPVIDSLTATAEGAKMPRTSWTDLSSLVAPIPSLEEQVAIVAFLDRETAKIDALIAEQERLVQLANERVSALALEAFSDPTAYFMRIEQTARVVSRPVAQEPGSQYTRLGLYNRGRGVFHKDPAEADDLGDSDFYWIAEGDLIISGQFAWEGAVALAGPKEAGCVVSHRYPVIRGKPGMATTEYLFALLCTEHGDFLLNEHSRGAAGRNRPLNIRSLLKERIPVPSLAKQQVVAKVVHEHAALFSRVKESRLLLAERRTALITAAVTGQIDVRGLVETAA